MRREPNQQPGIGEKMISRQRNDRSPNETNHTTNHTSIQDPDLDQYLSLNSLPQHRLADLGHPSSLADAPKM
ncbi:hypothetical protein E2C01_083021 [Portunus trituberculatus]|uniref:Uncharacterized protein n=1 Tax=Portunus trituberculatus TaxID=210409 RepID=A0A5B7J5B0_PORTR|nr:hypothetical protein [Portunus trituberculatus]